MSPSAVAGKPAAAASDAAAAAAAAAESVAARGTQGREQQIRIRGQRGVKVYAELCATNGNG